MREAVFEFELLTPAIIAGADQQSAEMRIPSIRGALRWWMRLIDGEETEKRVFGHVTGNKCQASTVTLRLLSSTQAIAKSQNAAGITGSQNIDYFLWPLRENTRGIIKAASRFKVSLKVKQECDEIDEKFLWAFLFFGSLGTRSRRAYGSVWPRSVTIDGEECDIPENQNALLEYYKWIFDEKKVSFYQLGEAKQDYREAVKTCAVFLKMFRCGKTQHGATASEWGKNDHDAGIAGTGKIYRATLGLPMTQRYTSRRTVVEYGIDGWERFASPLHFKVIRLAKRFIPVMLVIPEYVPATGTVLHGKCNGKNLTFTLDNDLLNVMAGSTNRNEKRLKELFPQAVRLDNYEEDN